VFENLDKAHTNNPSIAFIKFVNICTYNIMVPSMNYFFFLLCAVGVLRSSNAFLFQQQSPRRQVSLKVAPLDEDESFKGELEKLERARANFETLMRNDAQLKDAQKAVLPHSKEEYTPDPLTESSRRRRLIEMELLEALQDSNDAVEELMSLWMVERGRKAAEDLTEMENVCSPGLEEEEKMLRDMMDQHGIHWAEPVSRLASLLFFKGRSEESEQWCDVALAVKPWHFEVVHTHVLNALRDQDMARAIRWQRRALPPLNPGTKNKRRKAWVERALRDAQESLEKAEALVAQLRGRGGESSLQENEMWQ
jgi:hypothetical protein